MESFGEVKRQKLGLQKDLFRLEAELGGVKTKNRELEAELQKAKDVEVTELQELQEDFFRLEAELGHFKEKNGELKAELQKAKDEEMETLKVYNDKLMATNDKLMVTNDRFLAIIERFVKSNN